MLDHKERYESIEIPKELNIMVDKTIEEYEKEPKRKWYKPLVVAASVLALVILPLNVSEGYAQTMSDLPVIGGAFELLTFRSYNYESKDLSGEVNIPSVVLTDESVEDEINLIIDEKVNQALSRAEQNIEEYKQAYLETGGTEEGWQEKNMKVGVDYEVYSQSEDVLSFLVYSHESLAAVYAEYTYFNINPLDNTLLTLEDFFGGDYVGYVTESIKEQVESQKNDIGFFDDVFQPEWKVREDVDFYINEIGNPVIVLNKYEIAAGSFGRLEYEILVK